MAINNGLHNVDFMTQILMDLKVFKESLKISNEILKRPDYLKLMPQWALIPYATSWTHKSIDGDPDGPLVPLPTKPEPKRIVPDFPLTAYNFLKGNS